MMDRRGAAHHRSRFLFFPQIILMPQTSSRSAWTSRLGFILASAGSAVGLGAIWKFPYMAGTNGGSIFMLPTIAFSLTIGLALLIAEMSMGRAARGGAGTAYLKLGGRAWSVIGFISVATGALVLAFYSVVGGWCTHYFIESIMGRRDAPAAMRSAFEAFAADPVQSVMGHVIFLTTTAGVVLCGVERGIERVGKILMPLLFILMLILIVRGLMLPGAIEGVKFLFMPDPEAFTGEALLNAMGFAFFSLSVGSGSMMNYGSYLSDKVNVGTSTAWIVVLAVMSSILGGLMIMPAVFAFGLTPDAGPGLTFATMPAVFSHLPMGGLFAVAFYGWPPFGKWFRSPASTAGDLRVAPPCSPFRRCSASSASSARSPSGRFQTGSSLGARFLICSTTPHPISACRSAVSASGWGPPGELGRPSASSSK